MKNLIFASLLLATSATATFAQNTKPAKPAMSAPTKADKTRNVAFLIYDGVETLDLGGPLDVFTKANFITGGGYNAYTVGLTHDTVQAEAQSFGLTPKFSLDDAPKPDIIIVPGSSSERVNEVGKDPRVQAWLRANSQPDQTVMSICTGAFIVGEAGLFDGKDATTHWMTLPQFATQFPHVRTYDGVRYIGDGNIYSSGGVTSGIDGALHLVETIQRQSRRRSSRARAAISPRYAALSRHTKKARARRARWRQAVGIEQHRPGLRHEGRGQHSQYLRLQRQNLWFLLPRLPR